MPVPLEFQEKVQRYEKRRDIAKLKALLMAVDGLAWKLPALRLIGHSQFQLKDFEGAKTTWNQVRRYDRSPN